ncbi:MAG: Rne/Rng family ribonuclease [Elusimicrobiota bacterium]
MNKKIYADITVDEKRVAIVEQGKLIDLHIQRGEDRKTVGNIYVGIVRNVVEGINSCFVDIGEGKNAFLPLSDFPGDIKKGKKVLVQVTKEELQEKGAKISGKISLPGRHIVLMPNEAKIGVSRNIREKDERKRLREILSSVAPKGGGFVARTSAENKEKKEILREAKFLLKIWSRIQKQAKRAEKSNKAKLIYDESDIVTYAAREFLDKDTEVFYITDKKVYKRVYWFVKKIFPELKNKVKLYDSGQPLFEKYNLEGQIENLKKRKISLKCGGYIIIEQTEALTAIDVNTGRFTGGVNREETAMTVNMEAATAAASQIILRDIGGIIIIDFIDLKKKNNKKKLLNNLKKDLSLDKAKIKIFPMTRLGLIEITRQRRRESIVKILCRDCPYCGGSGMIFSENTMYIKIKRELIRKASKMPGKVVQLFINPRVAEIFDEKGIADIQKSINKKLKLRRDYKLHHEDYRIST